MRGLDGLRAAAILLVVLWHCATLTRFPQAALGPLLPLVSAGWAGVDLFFALSGFLITRLILQEEETRGGPIDLKAFYARRALRILPAFYLVLGLNLLGTRWQVLAPAVGETSGGPLEWVSLLTYWSNYFFIHFEARNPAPALLLFWSLCVEEHFYLLWPFFLRVVRRPAARIGLGLGLCLLFLVARLASPLGAGAVQTLSHLRMDSILWGAIGALGFESLRSGVRWPRLVLMLLSGLIATLFATGFLSGSPGRFQQAVGLSFVALFCTALVVYVAARPASRLTSLLDVPPLRAIGRVSYGMYLLHMQAIVLATALVVRFDRTASIQVFSGVALLAIGMTYAAASLMYVTFESPFLRLKRHFRPGFGAPTGSATSPTPRGRS
jgi:peptidoglycan/LPS O-acetylase OafA/YrhL